MILVPVNFDGLVSIILINTINFTYLEPINERIFYNLTCWIIYYSEGISDSVAFMYILGREVPKQEQQKSTHMWNLTCMVH